jgi:4-aminobutyrate aminotransferase-like enzyme
MGNLLKDELNKLCKKGSCAIESRGMGLHIGFEVIDPNTNKPLGGLFGLRCVEKGLYPGYFGPNNNVMRLHPTLVINKEQM